MSNSKRPGDSLGSNPLKRAKASQACASCRRHKTRCELLDGISEGHLTCHRCKVLNVQCSFESSSIIHIPPSQHQESSRAILINPNPPSGNSSSPSPPDSVSQLYNAPLNNQLPSPTPSAEFSSRPLPDNDSHSISARDLRPEDLVPDKVPWGPSTKQGDFDWTAAPLLAIQELASKNNPYPPLPLQIPSKTDRDLHSVLSQDQINRLLEIFESRYAPWMCLPPRRPGHASSPLLELIRCNIASRHLDAVTRASVSPRLQKLTETLFLSQLMSSDSNAHSIEALLILSLWSPLSNAGYSVKRDGRALASSAVSAAMDLRLSEASTLRSQALRVGQVQPPPNLADLTDKTRLWLLISNTESMTCVGTGRTPVSRTSEADLKFIDPTNIIDNATARDLRLGFMSKMLEAVEEGCRLRLHSPANFEPFYIESQQVIRTLACVNCYIKPLPIISQYEKFFFSMCMLQFHGCRLVLAHHFLRELRIVMEGFNSQSWMCARYKGVPIPMIYGQDAIESAQNVLTIFLSENDTTLLICAPDYVFSLITFSATWLIISNFSIHQLNGVNLGWANDKLISLTAEKLSHIAHSPEHLPARCAHMIMRLVHAWEMRHTTTKATTVRPEEKWDAWDCKEREDYSARLMPHMSAERTTVEAGADIPPLPECTGHMHEQSQSPPPINAPTSEPLSLGQEWAAETSDILMDATFWTTFMENLNTPVPGFDILGLPT